MQSYKELMLLAVLLALTSFAVAEEGDGASYYPTDDGSTGAMTGTLPHTYCLSAS